MTNKYFPYNKSYLFNQNGDLYFLGHKVRNYNINENLSINTPFGILTNTYKWFYLISHYQVDVCFTDLGKVRFYENHSKVLNIKCGYSIFFSESIRHEGDFYKIPGFSGFCINKEGIVKSNKSGKLLRSSIGPYGYPYVNVRDHDKNAWRSVNLHVLLAKAFVYNADPLRLLFVNHKDGIKTNIHIENLEWVTSRDNQNHAVESNLRTDNISVKVLDIKTKTVTSFSSKAKASIAMGNSRGKNFDLDILVDGVRIPKLIKNRYEVKLIDDISPWYHLENDTLTKVVLDGPFFAKEISTNKIFFGTSVKKLASCLGIDDTSIYNILKSNPNKSIKGYLFKAGLETEWPENFIETKFTPSRKIKLTNTVTKEIHVFDSLRKVTTFLGRDKRTIKLRLMKGKNLDNWKMEELDTKSVIRVTL